MSDVHDTGTLDPNEPEIDLEDDEGTTDPAGEPDAEGEDDAGADDDAGDGADASEAEPRGRRQFGELRESNRELSRRLEEADRRSAELTRRLSELDGRTRQQPQETPQQRESRLSLLSPEERIRTELQERDQYWDQRLRQSEQRTQASADRAAFTSLQASSKAAKRFGSEVEKRHNEFLAQGAFVERAVILRQIIGEKVLEQEDKPRPRAAANRQRQAARPASSGSDVRPSRSRAAAGSVADIESRYGDLPI